MEKREIGSNFHFSSDELTGLAAFPVEKLVSAEHATDVRYLSSGRQGIRFCLRDLQQDPKWQHKPKIALLPEYTCTSVIQPFLQENYQLHFYPLQRNLEVSFNQINRLSEKQQASVVLFHPYFGFDTMRTDEKRRSGVKYIYDATQSFYSGIDYGQADYVVASIRKWGAFPDGAYCAKTKGKFFPQEILPEDKEMLTVLREAYQLKSAYIASGQGNKVKFLELYRQASALLASRDEIHEMSELAQKYYFSFDAETMKKQRRDNYQDLLSFPRWPEIGDPIFPSLSQTDVPLYFPFFVRDGRRNQLQSFLIKEDIYAPVVWPLPDYHKFTGISDETSWIYRHILVLPIDQRYSKQNMNRIKKVLWRFV